MPKGQSLYWKCTRPELNHPSYPSCPYNRSVRHTKCPICANIEGAQKRKKAIILSNPDSKPVQNIEEENFCR